MGSGGDVDVGELHEHFAVDPVAHFCWERKQSGMYTGVDVTSVHIVAPACIGDCLECIVILEVGGLSSRDVFTLR